MWPKPGAKDPVPKTSYVKLFKPYGWIVGTGVYVDDVQKGLALKKTELKKRLLSNIFKQSLVLLVVCVLILVITLFVARKISLPLVETSLMLKDIAEGEGDLTKRIQISSKDETGELAQYFNLFIKNLQKMINQIGENAGTLGENASEMSDISGSMNNGVNTMSEKTNKVNTSAGNMNSSI